MEGGGDDGGDILVVVVGENGICLLSSATYSSSFVILSSNSSSFVNSSSGKVEGEGGDGNGQEIVEVQVGSEENKVVDTLFFWILAEGGLEHFRLVDEESGRR